jgi:hypothetical protein
MACPEIRLFGNSLLMYEPTLEGMLQLKRISLEDGSLLAQASYPATPAVTVQIGNGFIGLCDGSSSQVLILRESLEIDRSYTVPVEGETWYLNQELETVFVFFDEGLMSYDLESERSQWMLDNAAFVQPFGMGSGYVLFSYTDRTDKKTYTRCLNLSTATMETIPLDGVICSGIRSGDQWLLRQDIASGAYILVNQGEAISFTPAEGSAALLPGKRQLLATDESYRQLSLYDLDGKFLSRCSLPKIEYASVGADLVWSGYWQGYFFRDTYEDAAHLMFWDPNTAQEGENLSVTPLGSPQNPDPMVDQELYQRAQAISQRFGIDIRIAEQCKLDYTHYQADVLTDPDSIRYTLNVLELAFSSYPEGFFR